MSRNRLPLVGIALLALGAVGASAQQIRYVDDDAPGGDGTSWATAYTFLQDALTDPNATEIRIAGGTYRPDEGAGMTPGDRDATFELPAGVTLAGGYRGLAGGGDANDRDVLAFESVLSGDLAGNDGADFANYAENSLHVARTVGSGGSRTLDGLTVRGGNADGASSEGEGGGVYHWTGALVARNCRFEANRATEGGGLHIGNITSDLDLIDCAITNNHVDTRAGGMYIRSVFANLTRCEFSGNTSTHTAGGVYNRWGVTTLTDCTFDANHSMDGYGGAYYAYNADPIFARCDFTNNQAGPGAEASGGAVYHVEFSQGTYTDCTFIGNSANSGGAIAALYNDAYPLIYACYFAGNQAITGGGAVRTARGTPIVDRCTFVDNHAARAGAILIDDEADMRITNSRFLGNTAESLHGGAIESYSTLTAIGCLFSGNHAARDGGVLYCLGSDAATLTSCTLTLNSAGEEAGGIYVASAALDADVRGSILWANEDSSGSAEAAQIRTLSTFDLAVDYSCVQGWTGTGAGVGNTAADPLLRDAVGPDGVPGTLDDDARLSDESPSINAGDPAFDAGSIVGDLDGHSRVLCLRVDMGAYEFGIGDADCNRIINGNDFAAWQVCATSPGEPMIGSGCPAFDFDADLDGDLHDFAGFQLVFAGDGF